MQFLQIWDLRETVLRTNRAQILILKITFINIHVHMHTFWINNSLLFREDFTHIYVEGRVGNKFVDNPQEIFLSKLSNDMLGTVSTLQRFETVG